MGAKLGLWGKIGIMGEFGVEWRILWYICVEVSEVNGFGWNC